MPRVLGVISGTENQPSSRSFSFQSVFLKRRSWRSGVGREIKEDSEKESRRRRKGGKQRRWGGGGDRTRRQSMEGTRDERLCSRYPTGVAVGIPQPADCKSRPDDGDEAGR